MLHIEGKLNSISDVPSRSFGSTLTWHCTLDESFLTLFNSLFPLPSQNSWTGFWLNSKVVMCVISTLWTQHSDLEGWRRLPKSGSHIGTTGRGQQNRLVMVSSLCHGEGSSGMFCGFVLAIVRYTRCRVHRTNNTQTLPRWVINPPTGDGDEMRPRLLP